MKRTVTVATIAVITLRVTEIAVPVAPSSRSALPLWIALLTFSTRWYLVSRKPSLPRPFVRSST